MARGRSAHYDDQRELILERAAHLFARQGYSGTSMNQVAEACGLSKPALYHYFRDKYALLVHIAEEHVSRLQELVEEVDALQLAPEPRLRLLIERFVLEYARARDAHRVLTEDVRFLTEEDQARILGTERSVVGHFASAIGQQWPHIGTARLTKPTTMLLFGMINWMFTWLRPEGSLTHEDLAPMVADLFFGGVPAMRAPTHLQEPERQD